MSPLITHRRSRRRSWSGRVVLFVCVLVVAAVLIGGLTQVGRQSGPFDGTVNRSFATQAAVVADQSNATAVSVRRAIRIMQGQDRLALEADLDTLAAQASQQAARAAALAAPDSQGGVQGQFSTVFSDRAEAVNQLRSAIEGLLGMHPLAVAGAPKAIGSGAATPTLLSSTQATNRIAAAGSLLARSDRSYQAVRRSLARMAGHAKLPSSKWITAANVWQIGSLATQVDLVASSPSLAVTHRLVLRVVQITPPALPSPTGPATPTISVLSPTTNVVLSVVLSNLGSVDEPHASVRFTLTPQPAGVAVAVTKTTAVASMKSATLSPASFSVRSGMSYLLTVAVVVPAGQTDATRTSLTQVLQIAPST